MQIYLYKFNKRPNSTAQPLPTAGKAFTVQIKDECSFITPVLRFSPDNLVSGVFSPVAYNYVQIAYWQRFYYITDWQYINGSWEATLSVDVLASFKTEIGTTSAYVVRAAGASDGSIIDTNYPAKTNYDIRKINVATSWYGVAPSEGSYILGCINYNNGGKVGAISYYALNSTQLAALLNYLFTDSIFYTSNISEIGAGLFKSMFNPFQYIVSCIWFPFTAASFGSASDNVKVGYWDTGVSATVVSALAQKTYVTATIPDHPQLSRGSYLNYAPYSRLTLYVPPFGSIPIDTNYRSLGNYLYCAVFIDHITGQATIRVSICQDSSHLDEYNVVTERSSMMGVPIQLAQLMPDYVQTLQSGISAVGNAVSFNITGALSEVVSAVQSQMPKVTTLGSNGSYIEVLQYPVLTVEFLQLVDEDNTEFGRPLCQVKTINTLAGFIRCGEDDHAFSATKTETDEINRFLKSGFFYE